MEFPHLGQSCSMSTCKRLDFLPMKCDACEDVFCKDHVLYHQHDCSAAYKKDVQVPVCPLCNQPVPGKREEPPDIRVGEHIDRECQSDPAKEKRKIYTNKCSVKSCKQKEMIKVLCNVCNKNYCLKHRHPQDHKCTPSNSQTNISLAGAAALARSKLPQQRTNDPHTQRVQRPLNATNTIVSTPASVRNIQGNLSDDEALAKAIEISLAVSAAPAETEQEREDRRLAEALASSEMEYARQQQRGQTHSDSSKKDKCAIS